MAAGGVLIRMLVFACALLSGPSIDPVNSALAQSKGRGAARKAAPAKRVRSSPPRRPEPAPARPETESATTETAPASQPVVQVDGAPAAGTPRATKPRVYTFGGLDVEGKLKAPQLLYFRSRMRQELDTSSAERRSFLKELEKTADEKGL
jgi:hypothetical protein